MKSSETPPQGAADVTALLDELDQAHAAATPGPWQYDAAEPDTIFAEESMLSEIIAVTRWHRPNAAADAALIVAAVNATPKLTAALRAALDLADLLEDSVLLDRQTRFRAAAEIRSTIATALAAEAPAPRCKCSHVASNHSARTGDCWSAACGCASFRPAVAA